MLAALAQSRKALPECLPNPPVGCVIVHSGKIVAAGYTHSPGKHHAEADALTQIQGQDLQFLQMYVTLEPCPAIPSGTSSKRITGVDLIQFQGRVLVEDKHNRLKLNFQHYLKHYKWRYFSISPAETSVGCSS